jgi:hypothetical protein
VIRKCYHCSTAHPGISKYINKHTKFDVEPNLCYIRHLGEEMEADGIVASPTFMFPNSSVTVTKNFFYMMFIVPTSATTSRMRYEVYVNKNVARADVDAEINFFKQVEKEDKWLGNKAQGGLNSDTYTAGPLHPYMERAVHYFESLVRPMLRDHAEMEKKFGQKIWPARRLLENKQLQEDEEFCRGICESGTGGVGDRSVLSW